MTFVTNISYPPQVFEQSLFLFRGEKDLETFCLSFFLQEIGRKIAQPGGGKLPFPTLKKK